MRQALPELGHPGAGFLDASSGFDPHVVQQVDLVAHPQVDHDPCIGDDAESDESCPASGLLEERDDARPPIRQPNPYLNDWHSADSARYATKHPRP
jgi:hypothetical protein